MRSTVDPAPKPADHGTAERGAHVLETLAWAGIVGPVLFTLTFVAQELFRIEEYSPLAETVSALEAGPNGWVQQLNFLVFGVLTLAFAVGLHLGLRPSRAGIVGPAMLFASGVGALLAAVFPLREDAAGTTYDPGGHVVGGMTFFVCSALGLLIVSRRVARDPRWHDLGRYTAASGILAMAGGVVMFTLGIPESGVLHDWAGFVQRVLVLVVLFPCRIVLALRLRRVAGADRPVT